MSRAKKQRPRKLLWMLWFDEKSILNCTYKSKKKKSDYVDCTYESMTQSDFWWSILIRTSKNSSLRKSQEIFVSIDENLSFPSASPIVYTMCQFHNLFRIFFFCDIIVISKTSFQKYLYIYIHVLHHFINYNTNGISC